MKTIQLGINVSNFIDSYRNIGYTIETAIADIIDNSIFAKATRIDINMLWDDYSTDDPYIQIIDNGIGMSNPELIESMRLACKSPSDYRDPTDLGRFGLGLKSASFSQCNLLTVGSRKENGEPCCKQWDVSYIRTSNDFLLFDCSEDEAGLSGLIPSPHGTIVMWTQLDNLNIPVDASPDKKEEFWNQIRKNVFNHIAMTFGSFKNDISFYFNGNKIELWDPFLIENPETVINIEETISMGDNRAIKITSYRIPPKLSSEELEILTRGKSLNDLQGFYLYRNNRLIVAASWLGLKGLSKKDAYRLAHIRLDIDNSMDNLWHIDIKKEVAVCPPEIHDKLISYAQYARSESAKAFRIRKKRLRKKNVFNEYNCYIWNSGIKNKKPYFEINRQNPIIHAFSDSLSVHQKEDFGKIIKCIENYIPVMSIIEVETTSKDKYIENTASEISSTEIIKSFEKAVTFYYEQNDNYILAIESCLYTEPFISHYDLLESYLKEKGIQL